MRDRRDTHRILLRKLTEKSSVEGAGTARRTVVRLILRHRKWKELAQEHV
jgi:hypothetical protein